MFSGVRRFLAAYPRTGVLAFVFAILAIAFAVTFFNFYWPQRAGRAQPIPFAHAVHAGDKHISCFMCHEQVTRTRFAGAPPVETCMLCHKRIIVTHPWIRKLTEYYERGIPVRWERVNQLNEFVFFHHGAHLRRRVDCGQCHGDVKGMDRIQSVQEFNMGFCIQCHRDNNVSHDCWYCHR